MVPCETAKQCIISERSVIEFRKTDHILWLWSAYRVIIILQAFVLEPNQPVRNQTLQFSERHFGVK